MEKDKIIVGDKVHYQPEHYDIAENGIVKEITTVNSHVRVVYHCGGDWDNYQDYTGALTRVDDLKEGWK